LLREALPSSRKQGLEDGLKFRLLSIQPKETWGLVTIDHLLGQERCIMARWRQKRRKPWRFAAPRVARNRAKSASSALVCLVRTPIETGV